MKKTLASVLAVLMLSGCSVGMAMSGSSAPNLGSLSKGKTRGEIELHLNKPIKTTQLKNGHRVITYEYEVGNEPSAGRAVGHAAMDVLTLGLWEIVGTPVEALIGEKYHASVTYDQDDIMQNIETVRVSGGM